MGGGGHGLEGWIYRGRPLVETKIPAFNRFSSWFPFVVMYWWVTWHMLTEPEMVFGEFPDYPSKQTIRNWSDAELGIPPITDDDLQS